MPLSQRRRSALVLALLAIAAGCGGADGAASVGPGHPGPVAPEIHADHIMVRSFSTAARASIQGLDKRAGAVETRWTSTLVPGLRCVRVAPGGMDAALAAYRADPNIRYAEPDHIRRALVQSTPVGINLVNAPLVWPTTRGGLSIVADLDTGVDLAHPDLPAPLLAQSFIDGVVSVQDGHGHGTHTEGTILALDNTDGVVGVAPSAKVLVGKVLADDGNGPDSGVAAGIDWAVANHARVISMSLGGPDDTQALHDSCDAALAAGVLVVAAAGNSNTSAPSYPGQYSSVLEVSAIDSSLNRASFSNFGPNVSLCAPGVSVNSTYIAAQATWNSVAHSSWTLSGSGQGTLTANAFYCGTGDDGTYFPPAVSGQIAHIRRGGVTFQLKVQNAVAAGAVGVIISNNTSGTFSGTLNQTFAIPVVGISQADGDNLQTNDGIPTTICTSCVHTYANLNGTSMSCPHVSGVAALLFSAFPSATPAQVRTAMEQTAQDITTAPGGPGRDDYFGYGLVKANLALAYMQSNFGCRADFNASGTVTPQDLFDYLSAFFSVKAYADFNGSGTITVQDLFDFLTVYFAGC